MDKTVIDFYQTNYGNGEVQPIAWRADLRPVRLCAGTSERHRARIVRSRRRPFYRREDIDELKNFSAKAVLENEVRVKFELFGEKQDVTLRLICDKDCLIDDVKLSDGGSLKAKIKKSLKKEYPSNYGKIFKD